MNFIRFCIGVGFFIIANASYCWNDVGHQLIAQIASHHMTAHAKKVFNHYNDALDSLFKHKSFVQSSSWLDYLRYRNQAWLGNIHYIDLPFSSDGSPLRPPHKRNAISAIEYAKMVIQNKRSTAFDKGFSMRILLHVIGDLHQPLHATTQISSRYPKGDKGGNLFHLRTNSVANNLHSYWDRGGGFLQSRLPYSRAKLNQEAYALEKEWPCQMERMNLDPRVWVNESHQIGVTVAYSIAQNQQPDEYYQQKVIFISKQRIALAGCRLAAFFNNMAQDF